MNIIIPKRVRLMVYCDESCENYRYLALGASVLRAGRCPIILDSIASYRNDSRMHAELKWSKITNQKEGEYRAFINQFFALNNANHLHFHTIFADTHQFNHKKYNDADGEIGIYKIYYQLLMHRIGRIAKMAEIHVIIDERCSKYSLADLKRILNRGARKTYGITHDPFVTVEPGVSHRNDMMQMHDVVLGAIATRRNGGHLVESTRKAKKNLSEHVLSASGLKNYEDDTPPANKRFTIWNFRLQK